MYKTRYFKYKQKYLNLKQSLQMGGMSDLVLLDGTSSAGKTTVSKVFENMGYHAISIDDFSFEHMKKLVYKDLPNEYLGQEKIQKLITNQARKLMVEESKKYSKVVFDNINQHLLDIIDRDKIFIIIVYASPEDLVRNIVSRQTSEPRGIFVFGQFAKKYIRTDSKNDAIDVVNRKDLIEALKNIKYEFSSETELVEFATNIFSAMDINDDADYFIKLRDNLVYDYILNTKNKDIETISREIIDLTINN